MKPNHILAAGLSLILLTGCANTAEGLKEDASANGQKTAQGTADLASGAKQAGKEMGAATILSPKVKTALMADPRLNDPKNVVDVASTDLKVTLTGHVTTSELKNLATEVAEKAVKDADAKQSVDNQLEVRA